MIFSDPKTEFGFEYGQDIHVTADAPVMFRSQRYFGSGTFTIRYKIKEIDEKLDSTPKICLGLFGHWINRIDKQAFSILGDTNADFSQNDGGQHIVRYFGSNPEPLNTEHADQLLTINKSLLQSESKFTISLNDYEADFPNPRYANPRFKIYDCEQDSNYYTSILNTRIVGCVNHSKDVDIVSFETVNGDNDHEYNDIYPFGKCRMYSEKELLPSNATIFPRAIVDNDSTTNSNSLNSFTSKSNTSSSSSSITIDWRTRLELVENTTTWLRDGEENVQRDWFTGNMYIAPSEEVFSNKNTRQSQKWLLDYQGEPVVWDKDHYAWFVQQGSEASVSVNGTQYILFDGDLELYPDDPIINKNAGLDRSIPNIWVNRWNQQVSHKSEKGPLKYPWIPTAKQRLFISASTPDDSFVLQIEEIEYIPYSDQRGDTDLGPDAQITVQKDAKTIEWKRLDEKENLMEPTTNSSDSILGSSDPSHDAIHFYNSTRLAQRKLDFKEQWTRPIWINTILVIFVIVVYCIMVGYYFFVNQDGHFHPRKKM